MVYALGLGPSVARRGGSSPLLPTVAPSQPTKGTNTVTDDAIFKQTIDDLGGPDRVAFALMTGWADKNIRKAADKLVGAFDGIIPKDHPLRSSVAERVTGIAQSIAGLKYEGPVAEVFQRFFDYGQQHWYNGNPPGGDWLAEFERFSQQQMMAADDPVAEGKRLKQALDTQIELSKSIAASRAELYPPKEKPEGNPVRDFLREFDDVVGGALETFLDGLGVPPLKSRSKPPESSD